jgi:hypothetical protein
MSLVTRELTKFEATRLSFAKIIRQKNEIEECVLKLIKHPDTTGSQIMEVRQAMLAVEESLHRVIPALRAKYPYPTFSTLTRPWHKPEYDKYMEVKDGI